MKTKEELRKYYKEYYKAHRAIILLQRRLNKLRKGLGKVPLSEYKPRNFYKTTNAYVIKSDMGYLCRDFDGKDYWSVFLNQAYLFKNHESSTQYALTHGYYYVKHIEIELREKVAEQQVIEFKGE